jgi:hypothetical protein
LKNTGEISGADVGLSSPTDVAVQLATSPSEDVDLYEDFSPFPLAQFDGVSKKNFMSFSACVDEFFSKIEEQREIHQDMLFRVYFPFSVSPTHVCFLHRFFFLEMTFWARHVCVAFSGRHHVKARKGGT